LDILNQKKNHQSNGSVNRLC